MITISEDKTHEKYPNIHWFASAMLVKPKNKLIGIITPEVLDNIAAKLKKVYEEIQGDMINLPKGKMEGPLPHSTYRGDTQDMVLEDFDDNLAFGMSSFITQLAYYVDLTEEIKRPS